MATVNSVGAAFFERRVIADGSLALLAKRLYRGGSGRKFLHGSVAFLAISVFLFSEPA